MKKAKSLSYSLDRRMENGIDTEKIVWIHKKYYGYRKKILFSETVSSTVVSLKQYMMVNLVHGSKKQRVFRENT